MHGYWVRVTDGANQRHTFLLADDETGAHKKAARRFEGTPWRILAVSSAPEHLQSASTPQAIS